MMMMIIIINEVGDESMQPSYTIAARECIRLKKGKTHKKKII